METGLTDPKSHIIPGLPDFCWGNIPKRGKIYQKTTTYTKLSQNNPKISCPRPSKVYQNWYFLKKYHLAITYACSKSFHKKPTKGYFQHLSLTFGYHSQIQYFVSNVVIHTYKTL
jgi:hypothetical protein